MALTKTPIPLNFSQGLDTKSDDKQVQLGKFLALNNSIFDTTGRLTKRNGFSNLTNLPHADNTTTTTLSGNLLATGSNLFAYSQDSNEWINQGVIQPVRLDVQSMIRSSTNQFNQDSATAPSGLTCLTYRDSGADYYHIIDSTTGQQIVGRTALPASATFVRVFLLDRYFIIVFLDTVAATPHIQYIAIPIMTPNSPGSVTDIDAVVESDLAGFDGYVANNNLYLAWGASATTIKLRYLSSTLTISPATTVTSHRSTLMSVTADTSGSTAIIWIAFWDDTSTDAFVAAFNQSLATVLAPTQIINNTSISEITSVATDGLLTVFYETINFYDSTGAYPNHVKTDFVSTITVTQAGVVGSPVIMLRSVGLASKAFIHPDTGTIYVIIVYGEDNQPTYFLTDSDGHIYMKLAYANGGGYTSTQILPNISLVDSTYYFAYRIKDFLASVNKGTALPSGTPTSAIYTQTGINLAKFSINTSGQYSSEIANALHLTGGQLWEYDGVRPVEHSFYVWPENVASTTSTAGGSIANSTYYYVFTYEWTDNVGNLHRSAPSIPLKVVTTGSNTSTNTLYVPTLRLTYKFQPNPVRIVGYRWSTAQQTYYQFTSLTSPNINNPSVDYLTITDTQSDAQILGNVLLYTTGGVIENIQAPGSHASAMYKNRLFLIDAEDPNLLWYSKQVIQNTPVEMSDLLTIYVAPTTGAQGSTGPMTALSAMDDKLIMFKQDAIYYLTGNGPDNTGAQNDFSDPVYVTSSVGCANPQSIVLMPNGIMFESDKGIWLLGRDLSTTYIGAPVEAYNDQTVLSANAIPGTNQVRFVLGNRVTLMYDYYFGQWGTFNNIFAISSTLYQGFDTYLNSYGQVFQETPGVYLDGSKPVLMSFTTSWITLAGIQGLERFYFANLLGTYFTPFQLSVSMAYNYNPSPIQTTIMTPDNFSPAYGEDAQWGSGVWGGNNILTGRIFPEKQKCQSFQIQIQEIYDSSFDVTAGQGFNLSGLLLVVGTKRGFRTQSAAKSFG